MAINFPDSPVNGNTYTYLNINYTFLQPNPAFDGYWTVVDPAALSAATSTDINEGTSNDRYNTPLALNGSKYVREDEANGETMLNHNGTERLKTTAQGVEVTGKLKLGGDLETSTGEVAAYVVRSGFVNINGGTFYRLWSDNWLDCRGRVNTANTFYQFIFPWTYTSDNHSISCNSIIDNGSIAVLGFSVNGFDISAILGGVNGPASNVWNIGNYVTNPNDVPV